MDSWSKFLKPGEYFHQMRRVKGNFKTKDSQIPLLRGTSKDHKEALNRTIGHDFRPIMGAVVGPNLGLSELGSIVVRKIADNADVGLVAKSTEEVLHKFEEFNKGRTNNVKLKKLIVASMDIEKWYPNTLSNNSAKIIRKMWEESDLIIDGIEYDWLAFHLGKYLSTTEVVEEAFEDLVYTKVVKLKKKRKTPTKKVGRKTVKKKQKMKQKRSEQNTVFMDRVSNTSGGADTPNTNVEVKNKTVEEGHETNHDANENNEKENEIVTKKKVKSKTQEWRRPRRCPTLNEQRKMFGKALEMMLIICMDNHCYQFNGQVRVQSKGGPIGLKLTGEIADCVMIDWDKTFLAELKKLDIVPEIYTRFKDDVTIVSEALEKGSIINDNKIVIDNDKKFLDKNKSDEKVTIEVIQNVANGIENMIQFTVETPCTSKDRKIAILDVKVNINENEQNRIDFEFFEKPTKIQRVILADSAMSFSTKRTILTQECLRILRNTKIELGPEVQKTHLDRFMLKLKNSGFSQKFRREILDSAFKAFEIMKIEDKNGVKPLYRSRTWNLEERRKNKSEKKQNWWNSSHGKIKYKSVMFVTPTPDSALIKELKQREEELNKNSDERVKFVEKGGQKVKNMLGTKKSFKNTKCVQNTCPLCNNSDFVEGAPTEDGIPCNSNNVGYRWVCLKCKEQEKIKVYEVETGRSARIRGLEHVKELQHKKKNSVLYKHIQAEHKNETIKFKMEITKCFKDALTRQANEAVRISNRSGSQLLNSKSEFNHPPMARVVVESKTPVGGYKKK